VSRRLEDPGFRKRVNDAQSQMLDSAIGRLAAMATAASSTLGQLLKAKSETVRLGAARSILELHCRLKETAEFEQKFTQMAEEIRVLKQRHPSSKTNGVGGHKGRNGR
jgi:hypothetical protein